MECTFCTHTHIIGGGNKRAGSIKTEPIRIGDSVRIGTNFTILPGVTIGQGCVIAAGSVVIGDCEDNFLYGGVPARKMKRLEDK